MSNTRKARVGHCGKFVRPRARWNGHHRNMMGRHIDAAGADAMTSVFARQLAATQAGVAATVAKLLRNRQKTG